MKVSKKTVSLGDNTSKLIVSFESEGCEAGTLESRNQQISLLKVLADTPGLLMCGLKPFEKLTMVHNGLAWTATIEAVIVD